MRQVNQLKLYTLDEIIKDIALFENIGIEVTLPDESVLFTALYSITMTNTDKDEYMLKHANERIKLFFEKCISLPSDIRIDDNKINVYLCYLDDDNKYIIIKFYNSFDITYDASNESEYRTKIGELFDKLNSSPDFDSNKVIIIDPVLAYCGLFFNDTRD